MVIGANINDGYRYAGNSFGGAVASLLSFAIGQIQSPLKPWKWLYIVRSISKITDGY